MEKRVFNYLHYLSTPVTQTAYGLSYDRQLADKDALVEDKQFHYLATMLKIEISSDSCVLHMINEQLALVYSITIDEQHDLFLKSDDAIIRIIEKGISELRSNIKRYFEFIENDDETAAQHLLSLEKNKKEFMKLVNNENKKARVQLVRNTNQSDTAVRDTDIYSESDDILFENYQVFGIVNQTTDKMTLNIQHPEERKKFVITCNASFLTSNGHYDRLHALKSSGECTNFRCRARHGELTDTYSDYQLIELIEQDA